MSGYKDMTFCPFYNQCISGKECPRALTPEVKDGAENGDMVICSFLTVPHCMEVKDERS